MRLAEPLSYLRITIESIESEINEINNLPKEEQPVGKIDELNERLSAFQEAFVAVAHSETIDIYYRDQLIYIFPPEKSKKIARNIINFISTHRRMFIDL